MFSRLILVLVAAFSLWGLPARAAPYASERVALELVSQDAAAVPGRETVVALHIQLKPGWHTYWRNSGDAGLPPEFAWTLPKGWSAGDVVWPRPGRMPEGGGTLMTYGWEGEVWLPVRLKVPATAKIGDTAAIAAKVILLVCADICVPETADLTLDLPIAEAPTPNGAEGQAILRAVAAAPAAEPRLRAVAALDKGVLRLAFTGGPVKGAPADAAYFFPDLAGVIRHPAVQTIERGPDGFTLSLEAADDLDGKLPRAVSGVLVTPGGAWMVSAVPGAIPAGAQGLGAARPAVDAAGPAASTGEAPAAPAGIGLPLALLLALAGGLLLNLMPCVFPVLAMKAATLARHAQEPGEATREGVAYAAGVLVAFVGLASALLAAKAAGQAVGWGFQLQSPLTIAVLTLVMLGVGLNLSGVFQLGGSLQALGGLNRYGGALGAFLTGALAVVVAAPCFAPFMTEAVSFGLTHSAIDALLVFVVLGVGFAAPMSALALWPGLAQRLPRPGAWMETLKQILAFPMYAAAAWLAWVFAQQAGPLAFGELLAGAVLLALGFFLFGRAQAARAEDRKAPLSWAGALLALAGAVALAGAAAAAPPPASSGATAGPQGLAAEPWSAARLAALRAEGRPVFVNFTAAWCVTCQVNDRAALSSPRVRAAFQRSHAAYLVADWTRRDEAIAAELAAHGRAGVPLYLVYRPGAEEPMILPQLLNEDAVVRALEGADGRNP